MKNVSSKTVETLRANFENKVCTVFTHPTCRTFSERIWREYYAVRILKIDKEAIYAEHPYTKVKSFFFLEDVISLQEEVEIDPNNPEHRKLIDEYQKQTGKKIVSDVSPHLAPDVPLESEDQIEQLDQDDNGDEAVFVDIEALDELIQTINNPILSKNKGFKPSQNQPDLIQIQ